MSSLYWLGFLMVAGHILGTRQLLALVVTFLALRKTQ
jgi:hypothetical protein